MISDFRTSCDSVRLTISDVCKSISLTNRLAIKENDAQFSDGIGISFLFFDFYEEKQSLAKS